MIHIVVEETGRIVQCIPVEVAHAHDQLEWIAQRMPGCGQICDSKAKRPPQQLGGGSVGTWKRF